MFESDGLRPIQSFTFVDVVDQLAWAPNSSLIQVVISKRNLCYVRNIYEPDWHCKIDEGLSGISSAVFSPDSLYLLTFSEFNVRVTIWNLTQKQGKPLYILNPKFNGKKGIDFSGSTMCLVQQQSDADGLSRDLIALYDTKLWTCKFIFNSELDQV